MGRIGNIKDRKNKQDSKKASIYTKMSRLIAMAVKEGGSDPEYNASLKTAIEKAKSNNMPNDNIDRAIKKATGEADDSVFEHIIYEGYGPAGVALILEILSDNRNRTAGEIRHLFDKHGGNLGTAGCVSYLFQRMGYIQVEAVDGFDEETFMLTAIEAGAEDVHTTPDFFVVYVAQENYEQVKKVLNEAGYGVTLAELRYIPQTTTAVSGDDLEMIEKLLEALDDNDDVQEIHHNCILS